MKPTHLLLIVLAASAIFIACKKNEGAAADNILGTWKESDGYTVLFDTVAQKDTVTNLFKKMKDCEKDNVLIFDINNNCFQGNGALRCDTGEQSSVFLGKYTISTNGRILTVTGVDTTKYNVVSVDKTSMRLTIDDYPVPNSTYYLTYQKQ